MRMRRKFLTLIKKIWEFTKKNWIALLIIKILWWSVGIMVILNQRE